MVVSKRGYVKYRTAKFLLALDRLKLRLVYGKTGLVYGKTGRDDLF